MKRILPTTLILAAMSGSAFAHPGAGHAAGFVHGFMHPVGGLDHVLAMVAVGLFAAVGGGRGLWLGAAGLFCLLLGGGGPWVRRKPARGAVWPGHRKIALIGTGRPRGALVVGRRL